MIQDSGYHGRRVQLEHGDQMVMVRGVQCHHDGYSWRLAWDHRIAVFDSSATDTNEMVNFHFLAFTFGMLRIGCLKECSYENLTKFMQLMIAWLIRGNQVDSCVITLQIIAMSRGCFKSYILFWDLGDFTIYKQV
jgi:hypothetical protein